MLALLAIGTFTVGAEVLRRDRDRDLTMVSPSVNPTQSPAPAPTPRQGVLLAGSVVDVVVTGLRVRTAPTVDDTKSAKLEPLLSIGTRLEVIDGPVTADDYDWYLVQAIGLPHRGWVAAADHDGSPWVEDRVAEASATPTYSPDEAALVAGLRPDAAVACAPRRAALPARATTGVECRVDAGIVERVGAYLFGDARDAALTYLERMAAYGIRPASGDCPAGSGGDARWMPGDGMAGRTADQVSFGGSSRLIVGRSGCFLDENGNPNVRVTCGAMYVGILGRDGGLADLHRWAWQSPDGRSSPARHRGSVYRGPEAQPRHRAAGSARSRPVTTDRLTLRRSRGWFRYARRRLPAGRSVRGDHPGIVAVGATHPDLDAVLALGYGRVDAPVRDPRAVR
jgi:hypothetical protein